MRPRDPGSTDGGHETMREDIGLQAATPVIALPPDPRKTKLEADKLEQLIKLTRYYGRSVLVLMAAQLLIVNAVFVLIAAIGYKWAPPAGVTQVWLAATFVQIVSVVYVITRSLFPTERTSDNPGAAH